MKHIALLITIISTIILSSFCSSSFAAEWGFPPHDKPVVTPTAEQEKWDAIRNTMGRCWGMQKLETPWYKALIWGSQNAECEIADLYGDGKIDGRDLIIYDMSNIARCTDVKVDDDSSCGPLDLNQNSVVDVKDIDKIYQHYGALIR